MTASEGGTKSDCNRNYTLIPCSGSAGFFPLHGGFLAGWQVSIVASAVLVSAATDLSKGWISCSSKCRKQRFLLLGFGKL